MRIPFFVLLFSLAAAPARAQDAFVWWEGEAAAEHNFNRRDFNPAGYGDARDALSGGDWLFNGGARGGEEVFARWTVRVPAEAEYALWTRKFWRHGPFRWRFDAQPWRECGRDCGLADNVVLAPNICANWVSLGPVRLAAGEHTFEVRLLAAAGESAVACFDCFLLTAAPFTPAGKRKPGEKSGAVEPGWWAVESDPDAFSADALLDLRALNEQEAGESGFVKADGEGFALGNGKPVRFWAVNCGPNVARLGRGPVEYLAGRLAKCGVNLVRIHGAIFDPNAADPAKVDAATLDAVQSMVAALKARGIYTALSFYFPLWVDAKPGQGLAGYERLENKHPFAALFFNPRLQELHRAWAKALLTTPNPHTGKPLGKDPSIAMVELCNEDSYFFWTLSDRNLPPEQWALLEKEFGAWLAKRHGSVAKALAAWPGEAHPRDDAAAGRAGLFDAWHMTAPGLAAGSATKRARMSAQVRFLAEDQRAFYADTAKWLREKAGTKCLVVAGNWRTADETTLGALERWTYLAGDVVDRHGYFGGKHEGPRAAYAVSAGDLFEDRAAVREPWATPLPFVHYEGKPHLVSELGWSGPNRLRADAPLVAAAYGRLQGLDGLAWFAVDGPSWQQGASKFPVSTPSMLGQFPAAALIYRRGDVAEGPVVTAQTLDLEGQFALEGCGFGEGAALDELRAKDVPAGATGAAIDRRLDPRAFFVGRTVRSFGKPSWRQQDLRPWIDADAGVIRSATRELEWDTKRGIVTVNAARAQAAAGFLGDAGVITLKHVKIELKNRYGAVIAVALDGKPLEESARILLQAFAEEKPFGFRVDEKGRIADLGTGPMMAQEVDGSVTLADPPLKRATALDEHGYARGPAETRPALVGTTVVLPPRGMYVVVER